MRIQDPEILRNRGSPTEALAAFSAPQMNQTRGMVTLASMAAHEISLGNGVAFVVYFPVLVAGWVIAAIRAPLLGINI